MVILIGLTILTFISLFYINKTHKNYMEKLKIKNEQLEKLRRELLEYEIDNQRLKNELNKRILKEYKTLKIKALKKVNEGKEVRGGQNNQVIFKLKRNTPSRKNEEMKISNNDYIHNPYYYGYFDNDNDSYYNNSHHNSYNHHHSDNDSHYDYSGSNNGYDNSSYDSGGYDS